MLRHSNRPSTAPARVSGSATSARARLLSALARDRAAACRTLVPLPALAEQAQPDLLDLLLAQILNVSGGRP